MKEQLDQEMKEINPGAGNPLVKSTKQK